MAIVSHLSLILGTAVMVELAARAGRAVLPWWGNSPPSPLSRWGLGVLGGIAGWGLLFLAFALTGLFYPAVLIAAAIATACPLGFRPGWLGVAALRRWAEVGAIPAVVFAAAAILVALPAFVRESSFDAFIYHLGVPWQFLEVHKAILGGIHLQFQVPVPYEMVCALGLSLGDDRLARMLTVATLFAGCAVFAGVMRSRAGAWAGPLLVLSAPSIPGLASLAKSDIPASACLVAGAILTAGGRWGQGSCMFGCAIAGKIVYAPAVALWLLAVRPPARGIPRAAMGLVLPGLAWWIKSWLATGTPVFPFTCALMASPFWGPLNQTAFMDYLRGDWPADTLSLSGIPLAWVSHMAHDHALALLLLPALFLLPGPPGRRAAGIAVVTGMMVTLAAGHLTRFMVPLAWWTCLAASEHLGALPGMAGRLAVPALAVLGLSGLVWSPAVPRPAWRELARPAAALWSDPTPFNQTLARLATLAPRRLLVVGELRSYRIPGRIVFDGASGETPLIWQIAHASRSPDDIRRKIRQTGSRWLLYNFVSVGWVAARYPGFVWSDNALWIYLDYCRRFERVAWRSDQSDHESGGFYLFELARTANPRPPTTVWFAPGTEMICGRGAILHSTGAPQGALREYRAALARAPDVGALWNRVGRECAVLGDLASARLHLDRFAREGMVDDENFSLLASVDLVLGRLDEADAAVRRALALYPASRTDLDLLRRMIARARAAR